MMTSRSLRLIRRSSVCCIVNKISEHHTHILLGAPHHVFRLRRSNKIFTMDGRESGKGEEIVAHRKSLVDVKA